MIKQKVDLHQQIDIALLERKYIDVQQLISKHKLQDEPYYHIQLYKVSKLCIVSEHKMLTMEKYTKILTELKDFGYDLENPIIIDIEAVKYNMFEFVETDDLAMLEKAIFEFELKYPTILPYLNGEEFKQSQLARKMSYLEITLKLLLNPKQKNSKSFKIFDELIVWMEVFVNTTKEIVNNPLYKKLLRKPLKRLLAIYINLSLHVIHNQLDNPHDTFFQSMQLIVRRDECILDFFNFDIKITLFYEIAKMILPLIGQNALKYDESKLKDTLTFLGCWKVENQIENWEDMFQYLMLLILQQVYLKSESQIKHSIQQQLEVEKIKIPFINQLWLYTAVNFTQLTIKLKRVMRQILSHQYPALFNLYCSMYNKQAVMPKIIEQLLISPYEDDILRMKVLSEYIYNLDNYAKLHQLAQTLLASERIKEHPFRQVIIDMCGVFTGIHLEKSEEGLCFARLNMEELSNIPEFSRLLGLDSILAHIGFSYYNLGRSSKYISEKNNFYAKAIEYLQKSLLLNNENYLVHFNLSKIFAYLGLIDEALSSARQASQLNKADTNCLLMCSLLYSAKDDNQKALMIIESLIKENSNKSILHLVKASICCDKYIQNLQKDKELSVADNFGVIIKKQLSSKHQKSREAENIKQSLLKSFFGIAKQVQENENKDNFTVELIKLKTLQAFDVDAITYISYRNCIFLTIDILLKIDMIDTANQVLELVDDESSINMIEKKFYTGYILEKQNSFNEAIKIYEDVLKEDFYHVRTMTNLALLYLKNFDRNQSKVQRANELLIVASKFEVSPNIYLGYAILNQIQGNIEDSNNYLVKALELAKNSPVLGFTYVPDKLFYFQ